MKLRILGGPVEGSVIIDVQRSDTFDMVFSEIEKAVGKGSLWGNYQLHPATMVVEGSSKRVYPVPRIIQPTDTLSSLSIAGNKKDSFLMLKQLGSATSPTSSSFEMEQSLSSFSSPVGKSPSPAPSPRPPLSSSPHVVTASSSSPLSFKERMVAMYAKYAPEKLKTVDTALDMYRGHEDDAIAELVQHYGPEPAAAEAAELIAAYPNIGASYRDRLVAIYAKYAPEKLHTVAGTLQRFMGREEDAVKQLVSKYGPEPRITTPMSSGIPSPRGEHEGAGSAAATTSPSESDASSALSPASALAPSFVNPNPGASYRDRLVAIYTRYEPSKLVVVDSSLRKFAGQEELCIRQLVERYGAEPVIGKDVVIAPEQQASAPVASSASPSNSGHPLSPAAVDASSYRDRVVAIFTQYDPDKLDMVDAMLERFKGREEEIMAKLHARYNVSHSNNNKEEREDEEVGEEKSPSSTMAVSSAAVPSVEIGNNDSSASSSSQVSRERKHVRWDATPPAVVDGDEDAAAHTSPVFAREVMSSAIPRPIIASEAGRKTSTTTSTATTTTEPVVTTDASVQSCTVAMVNASTQKQAVPRSDAAVNPHQPLPEVVHVTTQVQKQQNNNTQAGSTGHKRRPLAAAARRCATLLAHDMQKGLLCRYFNLWTTRRDRCEAQRKLTTKQWVRMENAKGSAYYQLADAGKPAYVVPDLVAHVQAQRVVRSGSHLPSDRLVSALRGLIGALQTCYEDGAVELSTGSHDQQRRDEFLAQWRTAEEMSPIRDTANLTSAIQQATRLLNEMDDIVTVTRTQGSQLQSAKELVAQLQKRQQDYEAIRRQHQEAKSQLAKAQHRERELLKAAAEREAARRGAPQTEMMRQPSPATAAKDLQQRKPPIPTTARRSVSSSHRRREAAVPVDGSHPRSPGSAERHIVHLQQELAKARARASRAEENEEQLKQQLEGLDESLQRRCRRMPSETAAAVRSRSNPSATAAGARPAGGYASSYAMRTPSHTATTTASRRSLSPQQPHTSRIPRRALFSNPTALFNSTPRRSNSARNHNAHAQSVTPRRRMPDETVLEMDSTSRPDITAEQQQTQSPWPRSRYVPPPAQEVDHGPCPNCYTPLTSISTELYGSFNDRAAFCFSCRRSFTFGELSPPQQYYAEAYGDHRRSNYL